MFTLNQISPLEWLLVTVVGLFALLILQQAARQIMGSARPLAVFGYPLPAPVLILSGGWIFALVVIGILLKGQVAALLHNYVGLSMSRQMLIGVASLAILTCILLAARQVVAVPFPFERRERIRRSLAVGLLTTLSVIFLIAIVGLFDVSYRWSIEAVGLVACIVLPTYMLAMVGTYIRLGIISSMSHLASDFTKKDNRQEG